MEPCWWRNRYMNCCGGDRGLFVMQYTEYGICYTFNTVLNSVGKSRSVIFFVKFILIYRSFITKTSYAREIQPIIRGERQALAIGVVYGLI